jgi:hypothetical protein
MYFIESIAISLQVWNAYVLQVPRSRCSISLIYSSFVHFFVVFLVEIGTSILQGWTAFQSVSRLLFSSWFHHIPTKNMHEKMERADSREDVKRITGRHLKPSFSLCLHVLVLDWRAAVRFPARSGHVEALVLWIEITFFPLLPCVLSV